MGLLIHLASRYGGIRFDPAATGGGLAPWQERRAKEMLVAQLDGELSIEDLARECDLSRSHFARAFKKSTGQPPHRWLMARRLERAQELLATSSKSVGEIAVTCGFADQSHFTRVFMELHQLPPGQWRRTCAEG